MGRNRKQIGKSAQNKHFENKENPFKLQINSIKISAKDKTTKIEQRKKVKSEKIYSKQKGSKK